MCKHGSLTHTGIQQLFSIPERLCHYRNVRPTVEIYSQKRVGTEKTRFYIVQMFQLLM